MTFESILFAAMFSATPKFRRKSWPLGMHVEIGKIKEKMIFHRHANSVVVWPWAPTPGDLIEVDWELYREGWEAS